MVMGFLVLLLLLFLILKAQGALVWCLCTVLSGCEAGSRLVMAGNNSETLNNTQTWGCSPADRGMQTTARAPAPCSALHLTDRIQRCKTQRCCREAAGTRQQLQQQRQPEVPAPCLLKGRTAGSCGCYQLTPADTRALSPMEQGKALSYLQLHADNRQEVLEDPKCWRGGLEMCWNEKKPPEPGQPGLTCPHRNAGSDCTSLGFLGVQEHRPCWHSGCRVRLYEPSG